MYVHVHNYACTHTHTHTHVNTLSTCAHTDTHTHTHTHTHSHTDHFTDFHLMTHNLRPYLCILTDIVLPMCRLCGLREVLLLQGWPEALGGY